MNSTWLLGPGAAGVVLVTNMPWPAMARSVGEEVWVVAPWSVTNCWLLVATPPAE